MRRDRPQLTKSFVRVGNNKISQFVLNARTAKIAIETFWNHVTIGSKTGLELNFSEGVPTPDELAELFALAIEKEVPIQGMIFKRGNGFQNTHIPPLLSYFRHLAEDEGKTFCKYLVLDNNELQADDFCEIISAFSGETGYKHLHRLELAGNKIGVAVRRPDGTYTKAEEILREINLSTAHLVELDLSGNGFDDGEIEALFAGGLPEKLQHLELIDRQIRHLNGLYDALDRSETGIATLITSCKSLNEDETNRLCNLISERKIQCEFELHCSNFVYTEDGLSLHTMPVETDNILQIFDAAVTGSGIKTLYIYPAEHEKNTVGYWNRVADIISNNKDSPISHLSIPYCELLSEDLTSVMEDALITHGKIKSFYIPSANLGILAFQDAIAVNNSRVDHTFGDSDNADTAKPPILGEFNFNPAALAILLPMLMSRDPRAAGPHRINLRNFMLPDNFTAVEDEVSTSEVVDVSDNVEDDNTLFTP